jgi:hypothetical protein
MMEHNGKGPPTIVGIVPCGVHHHAVYFSDSTVIVYEPGNGRVTAASRLPESYEEALGRVASVDVTGMGR